jgi:hypothetical protein
MILDIMSIIPIYEEKTRPRLRQGLSPCTPIASPVGGTNVIAGFLDHSSRRGKKVPRKRQNGVPEW